MTLQISFCFHEQNREGGEEKQKHSKLDAWQNNSNHLGNLAKYFCNYLLTTTAIVLETIIFNT